MDSSIEMELERINSYKDFSTRQGEMKMLIGDLIYSNDFDINSHYVVYDCRKENVTKKIAQEAAVFMRAEE